MAKDDPIDDDLLTSSDPELHEGDLTPPHGDEVAPPHGAGVNVERHDLNESPLPPSSSRR